MLRFIHLCLILLCLLAYLSPFVDPDLFWPVAALGLLAPLLWMMVLLFGAYWWYRGDKAWWLSAVTLLLGWRIISTAIAIPNSTAAGTHSLTVTSLNGYAFGWHTQQWDHTQDTVSQFLVGLNSDILCLQEFPRGDYGAGIEAALREAAYPYTYRDGDGGLAIFSRFPLRNKGVHYFANRANGFSWCDVEHQGDTFRLYNLHLQSNTISRKAEQLAKEGDLKSRKTWETIKLMLSRYGRSTRTRTQQARQILTRLQASPHPLIVAGDFNDVPASYLYRLFTEQLQDAHLEGDWGLGATYAGVLPGLRIDYVMPDAHFRVANFEQYRCFFSDHKAVQATLHWQ